MQVESKVASLTIALILLGVALVVLLLGGLIFWWVRRKKTKEKVPLDVANLSISGTLGSAYGHIRTFPESQSLLSSRKSSTMTNQLVERAEDHMDGRVSRFIDASTVELGQSMVDEAERSYADVLEEGTELDTSLTLQPPLARQEDFHSRPGSTLVHSRPESSASRYHTSSLVLYSSSHLSSPAILWRRS